MSEHGDDVVITMSTVFIDMVAAGTRITAIDELARTVNSAH